MSMMPGPGTSIGASLVLEREIGRGAKGVVWLARHRDSGAEVAVKLLGEGTLATEEARARFRREAMVGATVDSPHIVRVWEAGHLPDGQPYLLMERLLGT